ncbi:hypothetical protein P8452_30788 [Trifolium repens]|nr:hypothetical protein P8452_30788 [Trifolium repens]
MSFLSVLVLILTVISLTNIEGNPMQQIHAQPNVVISNQLPTIEPHTSGPDNRRSLLQIPPSNPIPPIPTPQKPPISPPDLPDPPIPPKTPPEPILSVPGLPSIPVP